MGRVIPTPWGHTRARRVVSHRGIVLSSEFPFLVFSFFWQTLSRGLP